MLKVISATLVFLSLSSLVFAQTSDLEKLKQELSRFDQFSANFEQISRDGQGQVLQKQTGSLTVAKPNKFYWESEEPFAQLLVSNGTTLWVYDEDLEQVTVQALDKRMSSTPVLILGGEASEIAKHYDVYASESDSELQFALIPKQSGNLFSRLELEFNDGQIKQLVIKDEVGQITSVVFTNVDKQVQVPASMFEFDVPEGTDIIRSQ